MANIKTVQEKNKLHKGSLWCGKKYARISAACSKQGIRRSIECKK